MAISLPAQSTIPTAAVYDLESQPSRTRLSARVVVGDANGSTSVEVDEVRLARRSLLFSFPWAIPVGRHAWVEVKLPGGKRVRPLVVVLGHRDGLVSGRYVHLFPEHRRALDAHLASPSGY